MNAWQWLRAADDGEAAIFLSFCSGVIERQRRRTVAEPVLPG